MKTVLFLGCFSVALISAHKSIASEKILVLINSYAPGYHWGDSQEKGFLKAFEESGLDLKGWRIRKFYLDEKRKLLPEEIKQSVMAIRKELEKMSISAVFLADDPAFKFFYGYFKERRIPIGFSGIQGDLKEYGYRNGDPGVTGSMEYYNISAVVRLLKKIKPSIDSVLFVCDDNISGRIHTRSFFDQTKGNKALRGIGIREFQSYASNNYEDLIRTLRNVDTVKTAVIVASYFSYRSKNGEIVPYGTIDEWIDKNTSFLDAGLDVYQAKKGRVLSIAASPEEMGYYAAGRLLEGLSRKMDVSRFGIRKYNPLFLMVNRKRAKKLGLSIPYEVYVYEKAANLQ